MNYYNLTDCEKLINKYVNEYGGEMLTIKEGILGLGTILLYGAEGKKTIIINEIYLNPWSSGHTIRMYNKIPNKYQKLVDNH